eukprot:12351463-Ditylum_brightwellii.AAC.1
MKECIAGKYGAQAAEVKVVEACQKATSSIGNAGLLNNSTDGVSCETSWNYTTMIGYLES